MYALVDGSMVLLGPIKFNYRLINSVLEEDLELGYRVTSNDEVKVPIIFDENVKLLPARNEYSPFYDPKYHEHSGPEVLVREKEVVFVYGIREKSLEQVKDEHKLKISPIRKEKENATIKLNIKNLNIEVSTSRENRIALTSKAMGGDGPYNFKFSRDTWIEITKEDIQFILTEIDKKVQEVFDWELEKIKEIDSCETIDEVYNVVIDNPLSPISEEINVISI